MRYILWTLFAAFLILLGWTLGVQTERVKGWAHN